MIPYNSDYYIFDSHSRDGLGQSTENGYSILLKFVTIEHVLNFITTTYIPVGTFLKTNLFFTWSERSTEEFFKKISLFVPNAPFLYFWKYQKTLRFYVFRGYRKGTLGTNGLTRAYMNMFDRVISDRIQMTCSRFQNKRQKINEEHLNSVNFIPSGNTKYSQYIENF